MRLTVVLDVPVDVQRPEIGLALTEDRGRLVEVDVFLLLTAQRVSVENGIYRWTGIQIPLERT